MIFCICGGAYIIYQCCIHIHSVPDCYNHNGFPAVRYTCMCSNMNPYEKASIQLETNTVPEGLQIETPVSSIYLCISIFIKAVVAE